MQDSQRLEFETNREQMLHAHTMEKEEMASRADNQIEELQEELAKVQRDRDEALLLAENDRQQVRQLSCYSHKIAENNQKRQLCGYWHQSHDTVQT